MSQEMSEQSQAAMKMMLHTMGEASRTPLMKRPGDYGLDYEDVFFPAMDGTVIEAWFIPADSDRIIVFNHFKGANRYGFPGHLEPWKSQSSGFEVDFNPLYKALHEAGYNVLTYDLRGNGLSAPGPHPLIGSGLIEYRDAIGAMRYVKSREDTKNMKIGIYTQCFGANSTFTAIQKHPEEFADVVCMMALQPLSSCAFIDGGVAAAGIPGEVWEAEYEKLTSLRTSDIDMPRAAKAITFPTFVVQVRDDFVTKPYDMEAVYDAIPVEDKKIFWIEGTNIRTDCYRYFPNDPSQVLEWFDGHMKYPDL